MLRSLILVGEDCICLADFLELAGGQLALLLRLIVTVWVPLHRHLFVCRLDVFLGSVLTDAEHLVQILLLGLLGLLLGVF